ncbi:MAG: HAD-IB family hydrolase [Fusobacteriaceae bacterium]|nr:HAD-IB family hydrolase [Fusobacteriaceae bacterium]MBN2837884.1 HAD-IB family hydrolase [Fusobacteriaceae bacterium]
MIGAFFDIDGTLYRDSLMIEHFKKLIRYEVVDPAVWHNNTKKTFHDWDKRQGNYDDYLLELCEIYVESMKGLNRDHVEFISEQVIKLKGERVYKFTRERIRWHQSQGHKIIFISGSPDFLVSKMAKKYGATDFCGSTYLVDENNNFTGEVIPMWDSKSKQKSIADFTKKYNLDLSSSYAYGDTHGDVTMFRAVGHPIAINPAKELLFDIRNDEELNKKTVIAIERKDVVYKLTGDVDIFETF